jgi:hypothetical protein
MADINICKHIWSARPAHPRLQRQNVLASTRRGCNLMLRLEKQESIG